MEEVEMLLDGEYFAMTEIPSDKLDEIQGVENDGGTIEIKIDGKKQALRYTVDRSPSITILNMRRIH